MVKQRGKGSKQLGRGDSSWGGKLRLVKLTPQDRQNIKKIIKAIKAADRACDQPGSELTDDTPPSSPIAQAPKHVPTESFEGSVASSGEYSASPTASLSGESKGGSEEEVLGDDEVFEGGEPQVASIARTRKPEVWEDSVKGNDKPKDKNYKAPDFAPTGQSEEPVALDAPAEPASTSVEMPPGPSTSSAIPPGPSTSAGPEMPSSRAHPITSHQLSQMLQSINTWMYTASSKLSTLTTTIAAQSAPQPAQVPQSIEDSLKEILENQKKILTTQDTLAKAVDSHRKALKELAKEHKKLRKIWSSKEYVKELRADVDKLKVHQLPLDLLFEDPVPATKPQPEQSQRPLKRMIPKADDAIIQLADLAETSSSQPQGVPDLEPVQA
uniref:Uncharacterized protein n=1 Tax=Nicotiana tabacum TaxID=4097 RepID=A0A1S3X9N6_TOBAC|nr:PREDICTED: uncharacterized protein LOC107762753 [Nicotiana tabacum]